MTMTAQPSTNITQVTLDGATNVGQAYREGKYRLRLNQYLQRTVDHSADINAIACPLTTSFPCFARDLPQWGFSGRLQNATATTLQLDREVTLKPCDEHNNPKSYAVAVQITNPSATTSGAQTIVTVGVQGVPWRKRPPIP